MILNKIYIDEIIKTALLEDINYVDVTSDYLIPENQNSNAEFVSKADGVICGLEIALEVFKVLDNSIKYEIFKNDGDVVKKGDIIASVSGRTRTILKGERTSLNILQHLSGISTATNKLVNIVKNTNASIADTRKTLPGLRPLQKYAVTIGGGKNHRYNLSEAAMIKDNHIDAGGGIEKTVKALREKLGHMTKIEIEVRNLDELKKALTTDVDIIMLDNMSPEIMAEAVKITKGKVLLEASGNVTKENIKEVAESGVDIISIGALTHSVKSFDISLIIKE